MGSQRKRAAFLTVEAILWAAFLYLDLCRGGAGTVPVKYAGVLLCLGYAIGAAASGGDRLTAGALALTAAADVFLLVLDRWYLLGVALFCAVQGCYLLRIRRANGGAARWPVRLGACLLAMCLLRFLRLMDVLNALSLLYFANFLCNVLQASELKRGKDRMFFAGLDIFLCCDFCVGIFNQPGLFPPALSAFAAVGMWLFYLPGQVLIALSAE